MEIINQWKRIASDYDSIVKKKPNKVEDVVFSVMTGYITKNSRVLDYGCGNGKYVFEISKKAEVIGYDPICEMVKLASSNYPDIKFTDSLVGLSNFDFIMAKMVFMFEPNITQTYQKLFGLLKPSGRLIASVTHPEKYSSLEKEISGGLTYVKDDIASLRHVVFIHRQKAEYLLPAESVGFKLITEKDVVNDNSKRWVFVLERPG